MLAWKHKNRAQRKEIMLVSDQQGEKIMFVRKYKN